MRDDRLSARAGQRSGLGVIVKDGRLSTGAEHWSGLGAIVWDSQLSPGAGHRSELFSQKQENDQKKIYYAGNSHWGRDCLGNAAHHRKCGDDMSITM